MRVNDETRLRLRPDCRQQLMNEEIERAELARAAYYAARAAAESAYYVYAAAKRRRSCKGGILIAKKMTAAAAAYAAAASAYFSALDGAAAALDGAAGAYGFRRVQYGADASIARYEWYRSAPGISSRAHDIVKFTDD